MMIVLSSEVDTMWWPSGEKLTELIRSVCPINESAIFFPVRASQTTITPLEDPGGNFLCRQGKMKRRELT